MSAHGASHGASHHSHHSATAAGTSGRTSWRRSRRSRHAKADDAVDSIKVGRVAVSDGTKGSIHVIGTELHNIAALEALEMRVVRIS